MWDLFMSVSISALPFLAERAAWTSVFGDSDTMLTAYPIRQAEYGMGGVSGDLVVDIFNNGTWLRETYLANQTQM